MVEWTISVHDDGIAAPSVGIHRNEDTAFWVFCIGSEGRRRYMAEYRFRTSTDVTGSPADRTTETIYAAGDQGILQVDGRSIPVTEFNLLRFGTQYSMTLNDLDAQPFWQAVDAAPVTGSIRIGTTGGQAATKFPISNLKSLLPRLDAACI